MASGRALILRTCFSDMRSTNNLIWPQSGYVMAPDWYPSVECGRGLHGLLWGEGDGHLLINTRNSKWLVAEVNLEDVIDLNGKVKFPEAWVVHCGNQESATQYLYKANPSKRINGLVLTNLGRDACLIGGTYSILTGGDDANIEALSNSKITGGNNCSVRAGFYSKIKCGSNAMVSCGSESSVVTGGMVKILITGSDHLGSNTTIVTGDSSRIVAGNGTSIEGGDYCTITCGDSCRIFVKGKAIIQARSHCRIIAGEGSMITVREESTVRHAVTRKDMYFPFSTMVKVTEDNVIAL